MDANEEVKTATMAVSCRLSSQQLYDELDWRRAAAVCHVFKSDCSVMTAAIQRPVHLRPRDLAGGTGNAGSAGGDVEDAGSCSRVGPCRKTC